MMASDRNLSVNLPYFTVYVMMVAAWRAEFSHRKDAKTTGVFTAEAQRRRGNTGEVGCAARTTLQQPGLLC
jgi:hypothetical protein